MVDKGKISMTKREAAVVRAAIAVWDACARPDSRYTGYWPSFMNKLFKACAALHRTRGQKG